MATSGGGEQSLQHIFFFFSESAAAATLRPSDVKAQQSATWARVAAREE